MDDLDFSTAELRALVRACAAVRFTDCDPSPDYFRDFIVARLEGMREADLAARVKFLPDSDLDALCCWLKDRHGRASLGAAGPTSPRSP